MPSRITSLLLIATLVFATFSRAELPPVGQKNDSPSNIKKSKANAPIRNDYKHNSDVQALADKGMALFLKGEYAAKFNGGHYTEPDPETQVRDFWSNGVYAKVDRDGNGHFETVFLIVGTELSYLGSIGESGVYIHAANGMEKIRGKTLESALKLLGK